MKKPFLTLMFSLSLMTFTFAQKTGRGFELSLKSGLTLANQYGENVDSETVLNGSSPENFYANHPASNKLKTGINIGGLIEYKFNRLFSLGLGINYIEKGSRLNAVKHWNNQMQGYENVDGKIKWIQNYWTMDLPLKVYLPIKKNEFHLLSGLTFGRLSHSIEKGNIKVAGNEYEYTNDRRANKKERGFLIGAGYNYLLPNKISYLNIEFIWNRSFGKSPGDNLIPNPMRYYNQTFNFNIGYKFKFRNKK